MGLKVRPERSVINYHYSLHNNPEKRSSQSVYKISEGVRLKSSDKERQMGDGVRQNTIEIRVAVLPHQLHSALFLIHSNSSNLRGFPIRGIPGRLDSHGLSDRTVYQNAMEHNCNVILVLIRLTDDNPLLVMK